VNRDDDRVNILITGITGYVGSRLAPRLLRDGHSVRGLSRQPGTLGGNGPRAGADGRRAEADIPLFEGNVTTGRGLERALDGIDLAYYLIHSMEPWQPDDAGALRLREAVRRARGRRRDQFAEREKLGAENFARAARAAGTPRVVYLGGLIPADGPASAHLSSRLEVERILLDASRCSCAFRASIVIGAGSRSFRFLVRLVERLPVLAVPAWRTHRTAPIDERDMVEMLARAATSHEPSAQPASSDEPNARTATSDRLCGRALDAVGPEVVTYGELIDRIGDHLLLDRPTIRFKRLTVTPIASRVAAVIAGERHELVGPLMESLGEDLLASDDHASELLGVRLHSLDSAIEHALREWEATEPLAAR
jgi:uncharacterized protein YbjT (DUF2867 family)